VYPNTPISPAVDETVTTWPRPRSIIDGTTARIREKQKAGDFAGMAAQISDEHLAAFATEATWDELADKLIGKYGGVATRLVLYNALGDPGRFERYGEIAQRISAGPRTIQDR